VSGAAPPSSCLRPSRDTSCARCEKLQAACDEAVSASEKHEASLTKQVEANKALDNDLKMMCAALRGRCAGVTGA
jgi:hypothetical protein